MTPIRHNPTSEKNSFIANSSFDRISYMYVVKTIGPTMPIQSNTPTAAPRAAVFALDDSGLAQGDVVIQLLEQSVISPRTL